MCAMAKIKLLGKLTLKKKLLFDHIKTAQSVLDITSLRKRLFSCFFFFFYISEESDFNVSCWKINWFFYTLKDTWQLKINKDVTSIVCLFDYSFPYKKIVVFCEIIFNSMLWPSQNFLMYIIANTWVICQYLRIVWRFFNLNTELQWSENENFTVQQRTPLDDKILNFY